MLNQLFYQYLKPLHQKINSKHVEWIAFLCIFIWFAYQLFYYASNISEGTFPDEPHHIMVASQWTQTTDWGIHDTPQTYQLGQISQQPYLYHAFLGGMRKLLPNAGDEVHFFRYISVGISLIGFAFSWLFYRQILTSPYGRVLAIYFQSCLMMYGLISSAVSYDVLTNTMAFFCLWYFVKTLKAFRLLNLLILLSGLMIGNLVKFTFLPFSVILVVLILVVHFKPFRTRSFWAANLRSLRSVSVILIFSIFAILNLRFYGTNLISYKAIIPECEQILPLKICVKHYPQMQRAIKLQKEADTLTRMNFFEFVPRYFAAVEAGIFGLQTHRASAPLKPSESDRHRSFLGLVVIGLLAQFFYFKRKLFDVKFYSMWTITFGYIAIVMLVNYNDYQKYGVFGLGLQGRYLFPVLISAIYLIIAPIFENVKKSLQIVLFFIGLFVCQKMGFHIFAHKVNEHWFN